MVNCANVRAKDVLKDNYYKCATLLVDKFERVIGGKRYWINHKALVFRNKMLDA